MQELADQNVTSVLDQFQEEIKELEARKRGVLSVKRAFLKAIAAAKAEQLGIQRNVTYKVRNENYKFYVEDFDAHEVWLWINDINDDPLVAGYAIDYYASGYVIRGSKQNVNQISLGMESLLTGG